MAAADGDIESGTVERLLFFSDAVVAIAITLLALDLPVPVGDSASTLWTSVRHNDGHYLAFLISFAVIARLWSAHHRAFYYAERSDRSFATLNLLWLLTIVLNPFATKLLTSEGHDTVQSHALRYGFYALLQVLASAALLLMVGRMISGALGSARTPADLHSRMSWRSTGLMLGFGLSIPVFFITTYGWVLWIVMPLAVAELSRRRASRAGAEVAPTQG